MPCPVMIRKKGQGDVETEMRVAEKTNLANSNGATSLENMHITIFCQTVSRKYKLRSSNLILIVDHAVEWKPSMPCIL